jgi:hypothetical protein
MMKIKNKYKLLVLVLIILVGLVVLVGFIGKDKFVNYFPGTNQTHEMTGNQSSGEVKPPPSSPSEGTTQTSTIPPGGALPAGGSSSGAGSKGSQPTGGSSETPFQALRLEIIDLCSGKFGDVLAVSEGVRYCLNEKYPYYIILEKNSTHLETSLYNASGFNETYEFNESALISFVFVEDVASINKTIESFYIQGSSDFYLGGYDMHTIWERDVNGNLEVSKMIAALPLYVRNTVSVTNDWEELKFYLTASNKNYYLGDIWVWVKEK